MKNMIVIIVFVYDSDLFRGIIDYLSELGDIYRTWRPKCYHFQTAIALTTVYKMEGGGGVLQTHLPPPPLHNPPYPSLPPLLSPHMFYLEVQYHLFGPVGYQESLPPASCVPKGAVTSKSKRLAF